MEPEISDADSTSGNNNTGPPFQRSSIAAFPYGIPPNLDLNITMNSLDAGSTSNPVGRSVAGLAPSNNAVAPGTSTPTVLPDGLRELFPLGPGGQNITHPNAGSSEPWSLGYPLRELIDHFFSQPQAVGFIRTEQDTPGSEPYVIRRGPSGYLAFGRRRV